MAHSGGKFDYRTDIEGEKRRIRRAKQRRRAEIIREWREAQRERVRQERVRQREMEQDREEREYFNMRREDTRENERQERRILMEMRQDLERILNFLRSFQGHIRPTTGDLEFLEDEFFFTLDEDIDYRLDNGLYDLISEIEDYFNFWREQNLEEGGVTIHFYPDDDDDDDEEGSNITHGSGLSGLQRKKYYPFI
jgi:hypothetical protein